MSTGTVENLDRQILSGLSRLGGQKVGEDALVFEGNRIVIPAIYKDDMKGYLRFLRNYMESQEETTEFSKTFYYRPWDGAYALRAAFKKNLGIDIVGKATYSFFGKNPPELKTVNTDYGVTDQIPWGACEVSLFKGTIYLGATNHPEYGLVFTLTVECPKKYAGAVQGMFKMVEDELSKSSIYRGKAFTGGVEPEFLDVSAVDPSKIVYTKSTMADIQANVWTPIEHYQAVKSLGIPFKRAVLLEGPWGTGKSELAKLTSRKARENGITFLYNRPGKDDIYDTMRTARLYQPAVVFVEDIDVISEDGRPDAASALLDLFDGLQAKDNEVMVILTTNHVERIHKGMLRPGRLDAVIHIGAMDDDARERLVRAIVPSHLLAEDVDFKAVNEAMRDYMPAYIREAIDRAKRFSLRRELDRRKAEALPVDDVDVNDLMIDTDDLVNAAVSLRAQFDRMTAANEGVRPPTLDTALGDKIVDVVEDVVNRSGLAGRNGGEPAYRLVVVDEK